MTGIRFLLSIVTIHFALLLQWLTYWLSIFAFIYHNLTVPVKYVKKSKCWPNSRFLRSWTSMTMNRSFTSVCLYIFFHLSPNCLVSTAHTVYSGLIILMHHPLTFCFLTRCPWDWINAKPYNPEGTVSYSWWSLLQEPDSALKNKNRCEYLALTQPYNHLGEKMYWMILGAVLNACWYPQMPKQIGGHRESGSLNLFLHSTSWTGPNHQH